MVGRHHDLKAHGVSYIFVLLTLYPHKLGLRKRHLEISSVSFRMPHYDDDRYSSNTRLYVGHLSSRTRSRDLEHIFSKYGRVRNVDMKRDYAFVEFSDPRDADDAKYHLDGKDVDGRRITVEFARGVPRGPGGAREIVGRDPTPGVGRCFNCGIDGHWARDCAAGDWKNKCYRCGDRGHIERNCQNSPKKLRRDRSHSRSPVRSRAPRRGRSRSFSKSRSNSRSRSPARRGRDVEYDERRSRSPARGSPDPKRGASPSKSRKRSSTPVKDNPRERGSPSPSRGRIEMEQDGYSDSPKETSPLPRGGRMELEQNGYNDVPKETSRSPVSPAAMRYEAANGHNRSPSPNSLKDDRSPFDNDNERSPRASESP